MVLDSSKDQSKNDSDTHGSSREQAKPAELGKRPGQADEEANEDCHGAECDSASCRICESVQKLGADEDMQRCKD